MKFYRKGFVLHGKKIQNKETWWVEGWGEKAHNCN